MQKGVFIVLDGNDGSGKATQTKLLSERLSKENILAEKMDFPRYEQNFFGAFVGECLAGHHGDFLHLDPKIASTLYALDRLESTPAIREALAKGKVVIADRFTSSNQIHQGGKILNETERIDFLAWLDRMEHEVLDIPRPTHIVYLRVPVEVSLRLLSEKRAKKNPHLALEKDTVEEDRTYLEKSHETANWLAAHQPNWSIIDCMGKEGLRTPQEIHEDIWHALAHALP
ncbi:MAG: deoxynucleoside kinase [Minisyncoccia bacterium]